MVDLAPDIARGDKYSPVQRPFGGLDEAQPGSFPVVTERIGQDPDPFNPPIFGDWDTSRVTYQANDLCSLGCPGCYTGSRLNRPGDRRAPGRTLVPFDEFTDHMAALGKGLVEFYAVGAEMTMTPAASERMFRWAHEHGLPVLSITHGAVKPERFDATFGWALEAGAIYTLVVSLDSMDPAANNFLRGNEKAHELTTATIRRCIELEIPIKVQMTVWPNNYTTIMDSVRELYAMGVRSFGFHHGSVRDVPNFLDEGLDTVDPLAWRALCDKFLEFRAQYRDTLVHFGFAWNYYTEEELRNAIIGDDTLTDAYLEHVGLIEAGQPSTKPINACPATDAPQVYMNANGGPNGRGDVSVCNMFAPPGAEYVALYDPGTKQLRVIQDPAHNQVHQLMISPHLCPATPIVSGGLVSDRTRTELGDLFAGCRHHSVKQVPVAHGRFVSAYPDAVAFYAAVCGQLANPRTDEPAMRRVRRLTDGVVALGERARILMDDLDTLEV